MKDEEIFPGEFTKKLFNMFNLPPSLAPLILDFFIAYSRVERGIMELGFALTGDDGGVKPDWKRYAGTLLKILPLDKLDQEVSDFIEIHRAPGKLVLNQQNRLIWRDTHTSQKIGFVKALLNVKAVRDNLFHGNKEVLDFQKERDRVLVEESLFIILLLLEFDKELADRVFYRK